MGGVLLVGQDNQLSAKAQMVQASLRKNRSRQKEFPIMTAILKIESDEEIPSEFKVWRVPTCYPAQAGSL